MNTYQKGDRVKTACKGAEAEAEVTAIYKDEVQVRTPDGELRWRTVRTVQSTTAAPASPEPAGEAKAGVRRRGKHMRPKRR